MSSTGVIPSNRGLVPAAMLLAACTLIAYWPTLSADFVNLDDYQYVVDNELVLHPSRSAAGRFFTEVMRPSTVEGYYQPLTMLSLMMDAWVSGAESAAVHPFAFHLVNILLHAAAVVLVFLCARQASRSLFGALIAALVFALHPVQVESVAWISQRKTVLATPLALGCVLAYLEFARRASRPLLAASVLLYALACLAKPTILLTPLILPLLDVWPLKRRVIRSVPEKWPFALSMCLFGWIAIESQAGSFAGLGVPNLAAAEGLRSWIGLLSYNLMLYLGNVFWPMWLSPFRSLPEDLSPFSPPIGLSILGAAILAVVWLISWRRARPLFVGLAAFGLMLLPALGAVRFMSSCVGDRFLYFPLFFLLLPLPALVERLDRAVTIRPMLLRCLLLLVLAPLVVLMRGQQAIWQNSKSMWSHSVAAAPSLAQPQANLALLLIGEGQYEQALAHAERACRLEPNNAVYLYGLGCARARLGRTTAAIETLRQSLDLGLGPMEAVGHLTLAEALVSSGEREAAFESCRRAIDLGLAPAACHAALGDEALRQAENYPLAVECYRIALDDDDDNLVYRWNLGTALEYAGALAEAIQEYEQVSRGYATKAQQMPPELNAAIEHLRARIAATTRPAGG